MRRRSIIGSAAATAAALIASALLFYAVSQAAPGAANEGSGRAGVEQASRGSSVEFIGHSDALDGLTFEDTRVGGLSGLAYDPRRNVYYALVDRDGNGWARYYTLRLPLEGGRTAEPEIFDVTFLRDAEGERFGASRFDGEALDTTTWGDLLTASEIGPKIQRFAPDGRLLQHIPVPEKFRVAENEEAENVGAEKGEAEKGEAEDKNENDNAESADKDEDTDKIENGEGADGKDAGTEGGARSNTTFEGLSLAPGGDVLFAAAQKPLLPDAEGSETQQRIRLVRYERQGLDDFRTAGEFFYLSDSEGGIADIIATSEDELLVLEHGNKVFRADLSGSKDVSQEDTLLDPALDPVGKRPVANLQECSESEYEGMTLGPDLPGGGRALVLVSDNGFDPEKQSSVTALALRPGASTEAATTPICP